MAETNDLSERERHVNKVLAGFLEAEHLGRAPERGAFLKEHAEFAAELQSFFADRDRFQKMAEPIAASPPPHSQEAPTLAPSGHVPALAAPAADVTEPPAPGLRPLGTVRYFGDYELLEEVARGGMGVVYKARQVKLQRIVAVKMILAGELADSADVQRFHAEARAAANLHHPGIVAIHEVGAHNGQHYFSMDYIAGESLAHRIARGPLPAREAAALLAKVAQAVSFAHVEGVIHRDLKPANILLDAKSEPHVTDFGLAKRVQAEPGASATGGLTETGQVLGTASYMPPEQAGGRIKDIGPRSDVYSLGAVLYCALTGRPPFQAASTLDTLMQVLDREPVPPRTLNSAVPRDLETICLKCLEKDPRRRYGSAQELAEELQRFLDGKPILARPVGRIEKVIKWTRRRPALAGLLAAVILVTVIGITAFAWAFGTAITERNRATQALKDTEKARKGTERLLFVNQIRQAQNYLEQNDLVNCQQALEDCAPHLHARPEYGFLLHQFSRKAGHLNASGNLAHSDDGKRLVTGDYAFTVWDLPARKEVFTLNDKSVVSKKVLSADGKFLIASHGVPNTRTWVLKVWDLETRAEPRVLGRHANQIVALALSTDGKRLVSSCLDRMMKVWDVEAGKELFTLTGHHATVWRMFLSGNGKHLVSNSEGKTRDETKLWNLETGTENQLWGKEITALALAFSTDGKEIFTSGTYDGIKVWDLDNGKEKAPIKSSFGGSGRLLASKDGKRLVAMSGFIHVIDLATGKEILTVREVQTHAEQVALSSNGKRLALGRRQSLWVYDLDTGKEILSVRAHPDFVTDLALPGDGKILLSTGNLEKTIRIWHLEPSDDTLTLRSDKGDVDRLVISADGKRLISRDRDLRVWDLETGKETATLAQPPGLWAMALAGDGKRLFAICPDHIRERGVKVWEVDHGKDPAVLYQGEHFFCMALSGDSKRLAAGSSDAANDYIKVWDLQAGKELLTLKGEGNFGNVGSLALTADGKRLFAGTSHALRGWNLDTGREIFTQRNAAAFHLVISGDGKRLAGSSQQEIHVWDVPSQSLLHTLRGHTAMIQSLALSPDGEVLFSGSEDKTVKVWDLGVGKETLTLRGHWGVRHSMALCADGKRLAYAADKGAIKVWNLDPASAPRLPALIEDKKK